MYCNGQRNLPRFDSRLEFDISLIPYVGDDSWVEGCVVDAHACLIEDEIPPMATDCDYCLYYELVEELVQNRNE